MSNITNAIQQGKGGAIHRLLKNAEKAERDGNFARAAQFREAAENLKNMRPTVWG